MPIQINDVGIEKLTPEDTDTFPLQEAGGMTRHIKKINLFSNVQFVPFDPSSINTAITNILDSGHIGYRTTRYYPAYNLPTSVISGTTSLALNNISYYPFKIDKNITIDRLAISVPVSVASSSCRLGVYTNLNGLPNTLLLDAGIFTTATTGIKEATVNCALASGWYWLAGLAITAVPNLALATGVTPEVVKLMGNAAASFSAGFVGYRAANAGSAIPSVAVTTALTAIAATGAPLLFNYRVL